jgi:hypothetical protein
MTQYSLPITLFLLVATVARAGEPSSDWGPVKKGLQMSGRVDRARYRADEPIMLEVAIRNTSKKSVFLGMSATDTSSFDIAVSYVGGGLTQVGRMPLTKYATWRFAPFDATKNIAISLKEGEVRRYRFPLNRMYDMTLDGKYSVVVNRSIPGRWRYDSDGRLLAEKGDKPDEVFSKELIVEISDAGVPDGRDR